MKNIPKTPEQKIIENLSFHLSSAARKEYSREVLIQILREKLNDLASGTDDGHSPDYIIETIYNGNKQHAKECFKEMNSFQKYSLCFKLGQMDDEKTFEMIAGLKKYR